MALEVSVISDRSFLDDPISWLAGASTIGEISVTSVADMASKLVDLRNAQVVTAESAVIGRLNIMDHSHKDDDDVIDGIQIGSDVVTATNVAKFQTSLRKVHYCMASRGFVHLWHCQIGQNQVLLKRLARIFGVDVYANTGSQNAIIGYISWGDFVVCSPDGTCKVNVPRPTTVN